MTGIHWWQPSPGYGYGIDGAFISLCPKCMRTIQWFCEMGGPPSSE